MKQFTYDIEFTGFDNTLEMGNYKKEYGAKSKIIRALMSSYTSYNGIYFGNRMWDELSNTGWTNQTERLIQEYCLEAVGFLLAAGKISDITVQAEYSKTQEVVLISIDYTDIEQNKNEQLALSIGW